MTKYLIVLILLIFQISTAFSQGGCRECPAPQIDEIVNIGDGNLEVHWSIEESDCHSELKLKYTWQSCFVGGTSSYRTINLDQNPYIFNFGNSSHGNQNGEVEVELWAECNQFTCRKVCAESVRDTFVEVLSTCDCDLYSADYTCDQICFNIDEHDFPCVAFDLRLRNLTTNTTTEDTISSEGNSYQLCIDRNPLHSYTLFTKVDADCDPETTQLTATCAFYEIPPCEVDPCGPLPDPSEVAYVCAPEAGGFFLEIGGAVPTYRVCDYYLSSSFAGMTVDVEICEWSSTTGTDCTDFASCCETYQVPVPESCPQDCPDFPLPEDLEFECDPMTSGFTLAVEGFRVCPAWIPPSAAGTTVSVELCAWEAGTPGDCNEDGFCCETFQVPVPESCPQDCPDFPTAEDVEFECLSNEGGITLAVEGFRVCPTWLPSSTAGTTVSVELCAWEAGTSGDCNEDGICCEVIQVLVPECEGCIPNADCDVFSIFIGQEGSWSPATTYVSEVEANIDVLFAGFGREDHLTIMVNGATVVDAFAGNGFDEECSNPEIFTTSFCVYPCDEVSINVEAASCPGQTSTSYWELTLACTDGCSPTPPRSSRRDFKEMPNTSFDLPESNSLKDVEVAIFPNPVTDILNIMTSDPKIEYKTARVFHSSGKVIYTENISSIDNLQIDASTYTQGIYILELIDNNGNRVTKRFTKIN